MLDANGEFVFSDVDEDNRYLDSRFEDFSMAGAPLSAHSLGRVETSHPPPTALINSTFASSRRLIRSISFRSFARAVVCEVTTWR
jgi:hypothetical protein